MTWKIAYTQNSLLEKVSYLKKKGKPFTLKTWSRSSTIVPFFVGLRFRIYNGKSFFPVLITPEMIGHKLGEFASTRARYEFKKKKKKK